MIEARMMSAQADVRRIAGKGDCVGVALTITNTAGPAQDAAAVDQSQGQIFVGPFVRMSAHAVLRRGWSDYYQELVFRELILRSVGRLDSAFGGGGVCRLAPTSIRCGSLA